MVTQLYACPRALLTPHPTMDPSSLFHLHEVNFWYWKAKELSKEIPNPNTFGKLHLLRLFSLYGRVGRSPPLCSQSGKQVFITCRRTVPSPAPLARQPRSVGAASSYSHYENVGSIGLLIRRKYKLFMTSFSPGRSRWLLGNTGSWQRLKFIDRGHPAPDTKRPPPLPGLCYTKPSQAASLGLSTFNNATKIHRIDWGL